MKSFVAKLIIVFFLIACSSPVFAGKFDENIWLKLDKLQEAEDFLSQGRLGDARVIVESILEQYPDCNEAKLLHQRLSVMMVEEKPHKDSAEKTKEAHEKWLEYLSLRDAGNLAKARDLLHDIDEFYGDNEVMPAFLSELNGELTSVERQAENIVKGDLVSIESGMVAAASIGGSEKVLQELVKLYGSVKSILAGYKNLRTALELQGRLMAALDKAARVVFAKAVTVKNLDGCDHARPKFSELLNILSYNELEFYKMAEKELRSCED